MRHYGFEIKQNERGYYRLHDQDTFNNWGVTGPAFRTVEDAIDYARRCDRFKRGKSMTI
jgi:hypothetical protein